MRNRWNHDKPPRMPGKKVFDRLVKTTPGHNDLVETSRRSQVRAEQAALGHVVAIVEPYPWKEDYEPPQLVSWVQSTRLAVDAYVDGDNLIAFATELATGKPAAGVALEIRPFGIKAMTDDKGLATHAARRDDRSRARTSSSRAAATMSRSSPTTAAGGTSTAAGSSRRGRRRSPGT